MTSHMRTPEMQVEMAAHLVLCGLSGTTSPKRDTLYKEAIELWPSSTEFQAQVHSVAKGMGLQVAGVNNLGIALAAPVGSPFTPNPGTIHNLYTNGSVAKDHATSASDAKAVLCATIAVIAFLAYPDEHSLYAQGSGSTAIYAKEVRERMEGLANTAAAAYANKEITSDDDSASAEMLEAESQGRLWSAVLRCPAVRTTAKGRHAEGTMAWHVSKAFDLLEDCGHVEVRRPTDDEEGGLHIMTKDRFRKLLCHHSASAVYQSIRRGLETTLSPVS